MFDVMVREWAAHLERVLDEVESDRLTPATGVSHLRLARGIANPSVLLSGAVELFLVHVDDHKIGIVGWKEKKGVQ